MQRFERHVADAHRFLNQKGEVMPNTGDWQGRHLQAWSFAPRGSFPWCLQRMIAEWCAYAEAHWLRYDSPIGQDGVLGDEWARMGKALRGMLNGETGNLDCGTVDGLILAIAAHHGVNAEEM